MSSSSSNKPPSLVFVIPYRDRSEQKFVFEKYMTYLLEDYKKSEYKIFFVEQTDTRHFNRGALKNIGFLAMKKKYPKHYQKMTFVFNDVDTFPYKKGLLDYKTKQGVVKHFFGFRYTLGGIFSITGADYEKIGGFPNFWTWGYEDNIINNKVNKTPGMYIDRSVFFEMFDHNIVHMTDSLRRTINVKQVSANDPLSESKNTVDCVQNLDFTIVGNKIMVKWFDVVLPYIEEVQTHEIKLTDSPAAVYKMKKQMRDQHRGFSRNMNFM
jgi:hypothetical protein